MTELSKREIWGVKNMIRPSTVRIAASFDKMMDAVKVRFSKWLRKCVPLRLPYRQGCVMIGTLQTQTAVQTADFCKLTLSVNLLT